MQKIDAYTEINEWIEKSSNYEAGLVLLVKHGEKKLVATTLSKGQYPANRKLMLSTMRRLRDSFKPANLSIVKDENKGDALLIAPKEFSAENFDIRVIDLTRVDYYFKKAAFAHLNLEAASNSQEDITTALVAYRKQLLDNENNQGDGPSIKTAKEPGNKRSTHPVFSMLKMYPNLVLNDAPEEIKLMFSTAIGSWNALCEAHDVELEEADSDQARAAVMQKIVEADENNKAAHKELKHYNDTKTVLGKHPALKKSDEEIKLRELLDKSGILGLKKKRDSAYNNLTRYKKWCNENRGHEKFKNKADLRDKWQVTVNICDKLLETAK